MYLQKIDILNFKNIAEAGIELSPRVNCLLGCNGMGKSNLLEAVYYLSFARSFGNVSDRSLLRHGSAVMMVQGCYLRPDGVEENISCGYVQGKRKVLKHDGKEYGKLSEHIGKFPLVLISPADNYIVSGGGEERRRLMDMVISQTDRSYLSELIRYNKALDQRNRMLRVGFKDKVLYDSIEEQMSASASVIFSKRDEWVKTISPLFEKYYAAVSGGVEKASVGYRSILAEMSMTEVFKAWRAKDEALGYTSRGIQRDDLQMGLDGYSMRTQGSQGQIKTYTIALRLAIYEYLRHGSETRPLLLLDDIFDKLDADRVANIMDIVSRGSEFGQIFITDTNRKHLDEILRMMVGNYLLLEVKDGQFERIEN